jgi:CDK inhibitor PHO81
LQHIEAVNILLEAGSDVAANKIQFAAKAKSPLSLAVSGLDMKGSPASDLDLDENMDDLIPSLSLPPPIVPLQVFGHN